jgi:hypothetical protein
MASSAAPQGAEHDPRLLRLAQPLVHGSVTAQLAARQIAKAHAPAESAVRGDGASHADFDVVGVGTKGEEVHFGAHG